MDEESVEELLALNLALLSTARVSAWSSTESRSSLSASLESNNRDLSCNSWLLNLLPPRAFVLCPSLGEILTLFIFLFLNPVSLVWNSLEWCCSSWLLVVDKEDVLVVFDKAIFAVILLLVGPCRLPSVTPQFF